jgi:tape measure domain-containing protein
VTLQELLVKISADVSQFVAPVDQVIAKTGQMDTAIGRSGASLDSLASGLSRIGSSLTSIGAGLTAAITLPLAGVSLAALKVSGDLEQARIAFTTMMGSAQAAQKHLDALRDFAAKTPFEFGDLVKASQKLQALGFSAAQVIPTLTAIGDAAAGLALGADGINRISLALGQMQAKGKVSAQEMNQLAEAGIKGWEMLATAISKVEGKTVSVAQTMKMAEQGAINGTAAVKVLLDGMNATFGGMMEKQSQTLLGMWSNLKDKLAVVLAQIGDALAPVAKNIVSSFTN